jgi:hypothetical protein
MIPLYTQEQLKSSKYCEKLPLECEGCHSTYYKLKSDICKTLRGRTNVQCKFCSNKCKHKAKDKRSKVKCNFCGKIVIRTQSSLKKTKFSYCDSSCSAKYTNSHKTKGTRVSKLEIWLQSKLKEIYPNTKFIFNSSNIIGLELDIYIEELQLAFELNGIFHYEPIFGKDKLNKTMQRDKNRFQLCIEKDISLCIIDTSSQKRFTEESSTKFLDIIINVIKKHKQN